MPASWPTDDNAAMRRPGGSEPALSAAAEIAGLRGPAGAERRACDGAVRCSRALDWHSQSESANAPAHL